ncbi:hypothetical protein LJB82_04170, partial [Desulfovibrio sp. OttesenSCG-928-M16]|nr:hypothetical protein [Desulfovibrio sp. OttesenSCG-928-M16]
MPLVVSKKRIYRKRVTRALAEAFAKNRLVVLTAPMGYGKTLAGKDFIASRRSRTSYVSIRKGPHQAAYAWELVSAQLLDQGAPIARHMQSMGLPRDDVTLQHLLGMCKKLTSDNPVMLFFDDYHHAESPEINRIFEQLTREHIPGLRILLMSRVRPGLPLEDLRVKGQAAILGQELLAFSLQEAKDLFALYGCTDSQPAEQAWRFSEGWPAAISMSLQSYLSGGGIEPVSDLEKLISETIFSARREDEQRLLLHLPLVDSFTAEEAAYLSDDPAAPHRLRMLFDQGSFLGYSPLTKTYTLPGIFKSYLTARLEEDVLPGSLAVDKPELYRRAGECLVEKGDFLQALRLFHKAGQEQDLVRILQLFEGPGEGFFLAFDPAGVLAIIEDIPWSVRRQCPIGYLGFILYYALRVNREQGAKMLEEAVRQFAPGQTLAREMENRIQAEMLFMRGAMHFNDLRTMYAYYEQAHSLLPGRSLLMDDQISWTFTSPHVAFLYLQQPGDYKDLVTFFSQKAPFLQELSGSLAGATDLFLAEYLLETHDALSAHSPLAKAMSRAMETGQTASLIPAAFTQARLRLFHGQTEQAWDTLEEITPVVQKAGHHIRDFTLDLCRGYIAAVLNDKANIPEWLLSGVLHPPDSFIQSSIFAYVVRGKALMVMRDWTRLAALAEGVASLVDKLDIVFGRIHLLIFKAVVAVHRNQTSRALDALVQAVELARPDDIFISLAEYGRHVSALHQLLYLHYSQDKYMVILGKLIRKYARFSHSQAPLLT